MIGLSLSVSSSNGRTIHSKEELNCKNWSSSRIFKTEKVTEAFVESAIKISGKEFLLIFAHFVDPL